MSREPAFVAIDLGAESGRVVAGRLSRGVVALDEVSRFPNRCERLPDGLHWSILDLYRRSLDGLGLASQAYAVQSVGIDTWGVDYGLLDGRRRLLGLPFHYRDRRTEGLVDREAGRMEAIRAYETSGIRPMPINTVYQLLAEDGSAAIEAAHSLALIPDLLAFWLCGALATERTVASTTGLLDARDGAWATALIESLGLPARIFSRLVDPGTVLGALLPDHRDALHLEDDVRVVATATHDTAAAFAGVPAGPGTAVLSSGTWSLLGLELDHPVLTDAARAAGLSNERGVFGTTRLLRNIMGLWLIQQCRAAWCEAGSAPGYDDLIRLASCATDEPKLFDPDEPSLAYPCDMPARIEALLEKSGQHRPVGKGDMVRSVFVSLACKYRLVLEQLERVSGRSIERIHVIGGGSRNSLLCQLTADITGREVLAGPAEASALGNVLMQAHALGYVSGAEEMKEIARASVSTDRYLAVAARREADAIYQRFLTTTGLETRHTPDEAQGRNA